MEYNIEVINALDLIDRVHNKLTDLTTQEFNNSNPNLTRINALIECNEILINEAKSMLDEATNKTLAGNKS